ncbi:MAG: molybdopterin cofactor-binding domain-containing protein [Steroidobacteraceae bacterium]
MNDLTCQTISRRAVLRGTGALIVSFSLAARGWAHSATRPAGAASRRQLPGSLAKNPLLDAWIRVDADGSVTAFTGKVEFGQGIRTALLQVVAEELELPLDRLSLVTADTARTPDEGYTAGSHSVQDSGAALRNAAAQVREILIAEAARHLKLPADQLRAESGAVIARGGSRVGYGELVAPRLLHVVAQPGSKLKDPAGFRIINQPVRRIDIPAKVTGGAAYVQDMRLPGMLHARVVRPPSYHAKLTGIEVSAIEKMPGVVQVLRDGDFLAVVAQREFQAIKAMRALAAAARWRESASLPGQSRLRETLLGLASRDETILDKHDEATAGHPAATLEATYSRPYLSHGSIGPSCAVAHLSAGVMTIWTHTQGVYPDRRAIAEMLQMQPEAVRCIHVEGSGCYGHNGADDAAADAALIAKALPDRPIRLQWMREQEHAWEPFGPAMVAKVRASIDASGRIIAWDYGVWSNTHSTRPGPAGALLAAQHIDRPFPVPQPKPLPQPEGGGDRNAIPLYTLARARILHHFLPDMPVRVSALRSLGAHLNTFAIESFMDELALAAHADPVELRLRQLEDPRARDVVTAAAEEFHWAAREAAADGRGCGFAFARYKNLAAYCAIALQVQVDPESGRTQVVRVAAAVDTGEVINPDGVRNQIEGAILQSMSWTLFERVSFDDTRITSVDWATYPILRFDAVPASISVKILQRRGSPFLGCGEAGQGPAAAALANAVANATGKRIRDLPLNAARVKAAIRV